MATLPPLNSSVTAIPPASSTTPPTSLPSSPTTTPPTASQPKQSSDTPAPSSPSTLLQPHLNLLHQLPLLLPRDRHLSKSQNMNQLQNIVDRMKPVGDLINVFITKYRDLNLQISTTLITFGDEFRKLSVIGEHAAAGGSQSECPLWNTKGN